MYNAACLLPPFVSTIQASNLSSPESLQAAKGTVLDKIEGKRFVGYTQRH